MMIGKLKTECGDQFVTKVEGMLKDLQNSDAFMKEYHTVRGEQLPKSLELYFYVLSSNNWPISQNFKCQVPKQLSDCHSSFEEYYKSRN